MIDCKAGGETTTELLSIMSSELPPWAGLPATGPILRPAEAARYLGFSRSHYYLLAKTGQVPAPIKLFRSNGAAGVPQAWLDAAIAAAAERAA